MERPIRFYSFLSAWLSCSGTATSPIAGSASLNIAELDNHIEGARAIIKLALLPKHDWKDGLAATWCIGEMAAHDRLHAFLKNGLHGYKNDRNFPAKQNVSRLSAYLHWGEISPNSVWYAAKDRMDVGFGHDDDCDHFLSELGWREFSYSLLYHFPELPSKNLNPRFDSFDWCDNPVLLNCWQQGQTGYPIVDAGMRELRQTGYMHNRVRMIVGSFLKNLRLHWHHGEAWFWDCLVDVDLANNSAGWQWIAGCRMQLLTFAFSTQLPKAKNLMLGVIISGVMFLSLPIFRHYLCKPWEAPSDILAKAGIRLGETYQILSLM